MAVFRVERNAGYTVMSNHHLRNKNLTLKAKGLLSQMLSLPEDWDFTLAGLSYINREKIDAIREAIRELEKAGYIVRSRERDEKGRLRGADYVIYEQPQQPTSDLPTLENPTLDNPTLEKPTLENPTQINKDILNTNLPKKDKSITNLSNTDSIPILSPNPSPFTEDAAEPTERKGKEAAKESAVEIYREIIKDNIDYDILIHDNRFDTDRIDEILDLILETVCTARKTLRIAGDDYPAELVKSKFLKLNSSHIEFVLDCMKQNTTKVRNIKQYLRAVLFNAPSTIDNYYTALVAHDMAAGYFKKEESEGVIPYDKSVPFGGTALTQKFTLRKEEHNARPGKRKSGSRFNQNNQADRFRSASGNQTSACENESAERKTATRQADPKTAYEAEYGCFKH